MVKVTLRESAKNDLRKLVRPLRRAILAACQEIYDDWAIGKELNDPLRGHRVHRIGVYRIIYIVKESSHIEIVAIGHRRDIYENAKKR